MSDFFPNAPGGSGGSFPHGPDAPIDAPTRDAAAVLFNRYRVLRELGRGGMGVVLLAQDEELGQPVAIKLLPDQVVKDTEAINDLKQEVLRGMALMHPGIVRTHHFEREGQTAAIVMEYVEGQSLAELKTQQPGLCFEPAQILPWIEQLCVVLDYAHSDPRIVHRDLKPRNLMLTPAGRLKVADFGIAAVLSDSLSRNTGQGPVSGTPAYMSPQQAMGKRPSPLDDIYALGATIYELLTGKPPFFRGQILAQVLQEPVPSMAERREEFGITGRAALPPKWEILVAACLSKDPANRPQTASEIPAWLRADASAPLGVRETVRLEPEPARPARRMARAIAAAVVLLGGGGAAWWWGWEAPRRAQVAASRGGIELATEPPGAAVELGSQVRGTTPLSVEDVRLGKHRLRIELPGFDPVEREITVVADQVANPGLVKLVRSTGAIEVHSEPDGRPFELTLKQTAVAGEKFEPKTGTTPATLAKLPTGTYDLLVRHEGWADVRQSVSVERAKTARTTAAFRTGTVRIESEPPGATVLEGAAILGQTPVRAQARPGSHDYELRLEGYSTARVKVEVASDREAVGLAQLTERPFASPAKVLDEFVRANLPGGTSQDPAVLHTALRLAAASTPPSPRLLELWAAFVKAADAAPASAGGLFANALELAALAPEQRRQLLPAIENAVGRFTGGDRASFVFQVLPAVEAQDAALGAGLRKLALDGLLAAPDGGAFDLAVLVAKMPDTERTQFFRSYLGRISAMKSTKTRMRPIEQIPPVLFLPDSQTTHEYHDALFTAARVPGAVEPYSVSRLVAAAARDGEPDLAKKFAALVKASDDYNLKACRKAIETATPQAALLPARRAFVRGETDAALRALREAPAGVMLDENSADSWIAHFRERRDLIAALEIARRSEGAPHRFQYLFTQLLADGHLAQAGALVAHVCGSSATAKKHEWLAALGTAHLARGEDAQARALLAEVPAEEWAPPKDTSIFSVAGLGRTNLVLLSELGLTAPATTIWEEHFAETRKEFADPKLSAYSFDELYLCAAWLKWEDKLAELDKLHASRPGAVPPTELVNLVAGLAAAGEHEHAARWCRKLKGIADESHIAHAAGALFRRGKDERTAAFLAVLDPGKQQSLFWKGLAAALLAGLDRAGSAAPWELPKAASAPQRPAWAGTTGPATAPEQALDRALAHIAKLPDASLRQSLTREAISAAVTGGLLERASALLDQLPIAAGTGDFDTACRVIAFAYARARNESDALRMIERIKSPNARFSAYVGFTLSDELSLQSSTIAEWLTLAEKLVPSLKNWANCWKENSAANNSAQALAALASATTTRLNDAALATRRFDKARAYISSVPLQDRFWTRGRLAVFNAEAGRFDTARDLVKETTTGSQLSVAPAQLANFWEAIASRQAKAGDRAAAEETLRMAENHLRTSSRKFSNPSLFNFAIEGLSKPSQETFDAWSAAADAEKRPVPPLPLPLARRKIVDFLIAEDPLLDPTFAHAISDSYQEEEFFKTLRGFLAVGPLEELVSIASRIRLGDGLTGAALTEALWDRARVQRSVARRFVLDGRTPEVHAWIGSLPDDQQRAQAWLGVCEGAPADGF
ncbi:MAG: serine/threonine-protein kinase [Chthoniobacteraceae bacterium]